MFERFMSFLDGLGAKPVEGAVFNPVQLAAAALMFAVMDADGFRHEAEVARLEALISEKFDIEGEALADLISRGEAAEAEAVDLYQFTKIIAPLEEHERLHLIELMWEVVYADGELHEMEDNVLWRVADLIGVSQRDRVELRRKVVAAIKANVS